MPPKSLELGLTGQTVAHNLRRIRAELDISLRDVAERMPEDRKLNHAQVSAAERGVRQVTVDDLTALAAALGVSPITLLLPHAKPQDGYDADCEMRLTGTRPQYPEVMIDWLRGDAPLDANVVNAREREFEAETFRRDALPEWFWRGR
ncbi:helix-turn-helix domain-containing protein [Mycobacteroides abscessus]|uniref:helix-turn-helix domain-containing protein n=1 Tax=Mycobacteroides abscessus TaxID=36809 RepID=UPI000C26675B|nr:helix-turn-helix transcriptional regulator [Mycobacteroides abscessus]MBN7561396.1 helix-turn-helix transcriptional regulator [Mycobacteroides abscessus subsp. abscessus]